MIRRKKRAIILASAVVILLIASIRLFLSTDHAVFAHDISPSQLLNYQEESGTPSYAILRKDGGKPGAAPDLAVEIGAADFAAKSDDIQVETATEDGEHTVRWNRDQGWLEWDFTIPQDGAYQLQVDYWPLESGYFSIVRGLQIDGDYPFKEAARLSFERNWRDSKFPYDRNEIGQEIRPVQTEITGWKSKLVTDYEVSSEPLLFDLTAGTHKMRLIGVKGSVALKGFTWRAPRNLISYDDYRSANRDESAHTSWFEVVEAERFLRKSHTSIQTMPGSEPYISPDPKGRIVYNTLGGNRWRNAGEWVEWEIEVPRTGWYELDLKYLQGYRGKTTVYRTLMLDGAVPFREMLHYALPANDNFQIRSLQDGNGSPYQFYLTGGKHTLRLIADASPIQPALLALQHSLAQLAELEKGIRLITGINGQGTKATSLNLDTNRTWDLYRYDPNIESKIRRLMAEMESIAAYLDGLNQNKTDITYAIAAAVDLLQTFADNVNDIPNRLADFSVIQNNINTWLGQINDQSVLLDYLVVRTPGTKTGLKEPTVLARIPYNTVNFFRSFYLKYDTPKLKENTINVWVQRGRDYVELLRQMVEQDFTPRTGIRVNINLMPNPNQLILGNAAGKQPDIALGMATEIPADYAMRGALLDLSQFPDFNTVADRFNPGAMRSFVYNGGAYALPEVQNFMVMFYRTDILEELNLKVPDTWDDVYAMLPTLQENGKTMYYPPKEFLPFFYQNNADFYSKDGLRTTLDTDGAIAGFRQWTDLYTKYSLPLETPVFFNHFREGDMPIGIADFNTYIQLQVAAPEITGHWKIAPIPGNRQKNGEIARWSAQPVSAALIMKKSEKRQQAWEFLKWWTSDEVQSIYGNDIESFYGLEFRWNTANINALSTLAWPSKDLKVIQEQSRWVKNQPYVPGYYYLMREMDFAWNRTVLEGLPAIESLRKSSVEIQREMTRKQSNLGIKETDNLRVPAVDQPFDRGRKP